MNENSNCCEERRKFFKNTAALVGLGMLSSSMTTLLQSCEEDWDKSTNSGITKTLELTPYLKIDPKSKFPFINLKSIGCGIIKKFPGVNYGIPVLIIKTGEHDETINNVVTKVPDFVCFSSMCTHNNCLGNEDIAVSRILPSRGTKDENRFIICSCHGSQYNAFENAKVVKGPAEKPLKRFPCSYDFASKILTINF